LSGVVCARRVGNPLTTYYWIAMLHEIYGAIFLLCLGWGGVEWVMPRWVLDLLNSWGGLLGCGQS
jgi:TRAP-type C4-dicarboxylate transport system permease small subunit